MQCQYFLRIKFKTSHKEGHIHVQVLGSITSRCSGNKSMLLCPTDGWMHMFSIVDFCLSDYCLLKLSRQHRSLEHISTSGWK